MRELVISTISRSQVRGPISHTYRHLYCSPLSSSTSLKDPLSPATPLNVAHIISQLHCHMPVNKPKPAPSTPSPAKTVPTSTTAPPLTKALITGKPHCLYSALSGAPYRLRQAVKKVTYDRSHQVRTTWLVTYLPLIRLLQSVLAGTILWACMLTEGFVMQLSCFLS